LGLAAIAVVQSLPWIRSTSARDPSWWENRGYLTLLMTATLALLSLASWPLIYLLWQSYVAESPALMCIQGVINVGRDSLGSARHLPNLVLAIQWIKPAFVFFSGAWFAVYMLNRETRSGSFRERLVRWMRPVALLAIVDATLVLTYIAIPKKEEFASTGCCVVQDLPLPAGERESRIDQVAVPWACGGVVVGHGIMIAAISYFGRKTGLSLGRWSLTIRSLCRLLRRRRLRLHATTCGRSRRHRLLLN
jgi:hypothetical protein